MNRYHRGKLPVGKVLKELPRCIGNDHNGYPAKDFIIQTDDGYQWYCACRGGNDFSQHLLDEHSPEWMKEKAK